MRRRSDIAGRAACIALVTALLVVTDRYVKLSRAF